MRRLFSVSLAVPLLLALASSGRASGPAALAQVPPVPPVPPEPAALRERVRAYRLAHEREIVGELARFVALRNVAADRADIARNAEELAPAKPVGRHRDLRRPVRPAGGGLAMTWLLHSPHRHGRRHRGGRHVGEPAHTPPGVATSATHGRNERIYS